MDNDKTHSSSISGCSTGLLVRDLMTPDVIYVTPHDTIHEAWKRMRERRIRHLAVLDSKGVLEGLLTERQLLALQGDLHANTPVADVMLREVDTVGRGTCVGGAARFMLQSKESCLPVIDETGVVLGMLTEADFLRWFVRNAAPCNCTPATYVSVD